MLSSLINAFLWTRRHESWWRLIGFFSIAMKFLRHFIFAFICVCMREKRIVERGRWKLIIGCHLLLPTLMRPCWSTVLQGSFDFLWSLCSCFAILFIFCIFMIFGNCRVSLNNIASSTATIVMVLLFLLTCDLYCMIRFYLPICFSSHVMHRESSGTWLILHISDWDHFIRWMVGGIMRCCLRE